MKANPIRYRAFQLKYFGPADKKGIRVKIIDLRHKTIVTISRDQEYWDIENQAADYLIDLGISIDGMVAADDMDTLLLSEDFKTPIK